MKTLTKPRPQPLRPAGRVPKGRELRIRQFVREIRSELKKVVWPSRKEAINLTIMVTAVSIAVSAFLYLVDYLFKQIFRFVIGGV